MVPANTVSPTAFYTGRDSPVKLLLSSAVLPAVTVLSISTLSLGLTATSARTVTSSTSTVSPERRVARPGRSASMALRALVMALVSKPVRQREEDDGGGGTLVVVADGCGSNDGKGSSVC